MVFGLFSSARAQYQDVPESEAEEEREGGSATIFKLESSSFVRAFAYIIIPA